MAKKFGVLYRVAYPIEASDAEALRSGELDPAVATVRATGVPDPRDHESIVVNVDWELDRSDPSVVVTFWSWR